jgi:hypothetical protein
MALEAAKGDLCDRLGLLNDAIALAKANLAKLGSALTLMESFAAQGECKYQTLAKVQTSYPIFRLRPFRYHFGRDSRDLRVVVGYMVGKFEHRRELA